MIGKKHKDGQIDQIANEMTMNNRVCSEKNEGEHTV